MIPDLGFAALRPYLAVILGLAGDYAISRGWLQPANRQSWVDGWIQLISATGSILLGAIVVWHEFQIFLKKTLANQTTTITTVKDSPTVSETTTQTSTNDAVKPVSILYSTPTPIPTSPSGIIK